MRFYSFQLIDRMLQTTIHTTGPQRPLSFGGISIIQDVDNLLRTENDLDAIRPKSIQSAVSTSKTKSCFCKKKKIVLWYMGIPGSQHERNPGKFLSVKTHILGFLLNMESRTVVGFNRNLLFSNLSSPRRLFEKV